MTAKGVVLSQPSYSGSMAANKQELVSKRTRSEFREICVGSVAREIERAFEDEGFGQAKNSGPQDPVWRNGTRRGIFDLYSSAIDWTDEWEVGRALRVFETIIGWIDRDNTYGASTWSKVSALLGRDGYEVTDDGRIVARRSQLRTGDLPLEVLSDPRALHEHIERMERSADDDPAMAISQSKALVEATAKLVLLELEVPYDEKGDVPELTRAAQKALALHPEMIAPNAKGAEYSRKILGALSTIAVGLAELRNVYGPDHGRSEAPGPLSPRHAHLAIGAATTYCRMMLETLRVRREVAGRAETES